MTHEQRVEQQWVRKDGITTIKWMFAVVVEETQAQRCGQRASQAPAFVRDSRSGPDRGDGGARRPRRACMQRRQHRSPARERACTCMEGGVSATRIRANAKHKSGFQRARGRGRNASMQSHLGSCTSKEMHPRAL